MDSMRIDIRARAAFVPSRRASGVRRILRHFHEYQQHDTEWNLIQRMPDGSSVLSHNRLLATDDEEWLAGFAPRAALPVMPHSDGWGGVLCAIYTHAVGCALRARRTLRWRDACEGR